MKIQLPMENWSDLLPFVPRRQLVALLFILDDRQFAGILQFCLNEDGHITLGHLRIMPPKENNAIDGPIVELTKMMVPVLETPMPDEPIPKNVHNFNSITLRYFDSSVLDFLQKFHQHKNALLTNVNLSIYYDLPMETAQPILAQILPLIGDNINSLQVDYSFLGYSRLLNNNQSSGNNDEFSELMTNMLAQTWILSTQISFAFDSCCRWLYAPRMDGRPRMLSLFVYHVTTASDFINRIKKDFLMAKHPVTFFIRVKTVPIFELHNICLENAETNENLLMIGKREWHNKAILISRFPREAYGAEWIQAYGQEIFEFGRVSHDRTIYLNLDTEIEDNNEVIYSYDSNGAKVPRMINA